MKYKISATEVLKFEVKSFLFRLAGLDKPNLNRDSNLLHLGCGSNYTDGMVNADFFGAFRFWLDTKRLDWQLDLRYPLNCEDSVFDGVFTEHTLEHLYIDEVEALLKEIYRVMKAGTVIRITVPDLKKYVDFYTGSMDDKHAQIYQQKFTTKAASIRNLTQNYLHRSVWDFEELKLYLEDSGFSDIKQKQYLDCTNPKLCLDRKARSWETLYVEARKL